MAKLPGLFFLKSYPSEEVWRLFVDGRFWVKENGWQGYESREPGSLSAALESLCSTALEIEESDKDFELSVDLIKSIHKKCGRKVEELADKNPGEPRTTEPVSFGIPANRASIKGIEEFLQLFFLRKSKASFGPGQGGMFAPKFDKDYFEDLQQEQIPELAKSIYADMCNHGHSVTSHFYLAVRENVEFFLEAITQSYNNEIKQAKTVDEKLQVIAKHIRQYEVLHPFRDANGRTFVNNLLNILLMQQGLPPATFYEPNVFDLYSTNELAVIIKEAIFNTMQIIKNNETGISLYGYNSTKENGTKFKEMLDSPSFSMIQSLEFLPSQESLVVEQAESCTASLSNEYPLHRGAAYFSDPNDIKALVSMHQSKINQCIDQGAPPLYVGRTPIQLAILMHNSAMLEELLAQKADLSIQDLDGKTVLHYAAEFGNMKVMGKIMSALLTQENSMQILNMKDKQGKTAFHYAAEFGSYGIIDTLTDTDNIEINTLDNRGASAITLAYQNKHFTTVEKLLNPDVHISHELLQMIMNRNDIGTFQKIIAKNQQILKNPEAFFVAIHLGSRTIIKKFLDAGFDINAPLTERNETALMLAVQNGNEKITKYLLKHHANSNLTSNDNSSILHFVFYSNPAHWVNLIKIITDENPLLINREDGSNKTPIFSAIRDYNITKILMDRGASLDHKDKFENNILHHAMGRCELPIIQELVNTKRALLHERNSNGRNPLHEALNSYSSFSEEKFIELTMLSIKEKVNLKTADGNNATTLDCALSKNFCHLSVLLMKNGVHTNIVQPTKFLKKCESELILEQYEEFKQLLNKKLSKNPLVAMGQLNDLYMEIKKNTIRTPKNFMPEGFSLFKGKSSDSKAHKKVLSGLKELYDIKLKEALSRHPADNLKDLIHHQQLSKKIDKPASQLISGETHKIKWTM
ncbi:ankyrin repeat-containing protein [Legionella gratiana]|uniref:Ankyrin repeat-containing protein n=1 Tax=Legionella gratiana TaxID=45066 RepID=A0A378JEB1_9GAMM|nr:Dot/Icm T4SS effector AnkN/AnkX/LegA8 [Legionella gratiana]KTD06147.1 ankyrin repeat-containing protein [Legionella gratiana]STX42960.1 ankyrin repeat-containing protein [Legionella gratiana]